MGDCGELRVGLRWGIEVGWEFEGLRLGFLVLGFGVWV